MKDLWERFKAWWGASDPFEDECNRLAELHKQNKEREKEWIEACEKQERQELRDRFAMAALTGLLAARNVGEAVADRAFMVVAAEAWKQADAMLKARGDD